MRRLRSSVIPELGEGEETEEARSVSEWAAWRAGQVVRGELKPMSRGGERAGARGDGDTGE